MTSRPTSTIGKGEACILLKVDSRRNHRPVCRAVEAGTPDSASVDLTAVKVGECAYLRSTELEFWGRWKH